MREPKMPTAKQKVLQVKLDKLREKLEFAAAKMVPIHHVELNSWEIERIIKTLK